MCPAAARVGLSQVALAGYFTLAATYFLFAGPPEISPGAERASATSIVFVHPAEFLVTDPTGEMVSRTILGDRLLITPEQVGQAEDKNQVFFFDFTPPATRIPSALDDRASSWPGRCP